MVLCNSPAGPSTESGARLCADAVHGCVFPPQRRWATASSSHLAELRTDTKAITASHLCSQLIIDTANARRRWLVT